MRVRPSLRLTAMLALSKPPRQLAARLALSAATLTLSAATLAFGAPAALAAGPEEPVTKAASAVTGTSATLNGELNPGASATTGYQFSYNAGPSCTEGPVTEPSAEATGKSIAVSTPLTELVPSTEYTFCVIATHTEGEATETTSGQPVSFTTLGLAPSIASESSSAITPFEATLEALVNPNNQTTSCVFEYGPTNTYGTSVPCEPETLEGFGEQGATFRVTALEPGSTLHYRVVVENATGKTEGEDHELTTSTLEAPIVDSQSASAITPFTATLEAQVNPNFQETTYHFEYATNEALSGATVVAGATPLEPVGGDFLASVPIGPLTRGTTYFYRVVAENATGPTDGPVQSFVTVGLPSVDGAPAVASEVGRHSVSLSGTVDPGGAATTYRFDYGTTTAYGASTPSVPAGTEAGAVAVKPLVLGELQSSTTYHFRLVASSEAGTSLGADHSFTTTEALPPLASTGAASSVTSNSATVSASIDPRGLTGATYQLQLGTSTAYGNSLSGSALSVSPQSLSFSLANLTPGVTYHYRIVVRSEDGTTAGSDQSFSTPGFSFPLSVSASPALLPPPAPIPTTKPVITVPVKPHPLSRAQKLKRALAACKRKPRRHRPACQRQARKRYGSKRAKTGRRK